LRVFVSYSHDSAEHAERVLALADRLRRDGLDAWIDQYDPEPEQGWPRWMADEIARAERVLAICTETYRRRFEGHETEGGLGVDWEGAVLTGELYRRRKRFVVPVVLARADAEHLPTALRDLKYHVVDGESGYQDLYRLLTGQPAAPAPPLGPLKALPPRPRRSSFGLLSRTPTSPEPVDDAALAAYRDWASERYGYLDLVGLGAGGVRLGLDEIYVPLRILGRQERLDAEGKVPREQLFAGGGSAVELDRLFLRPAGDASDRHALIFGEAGSGKTTALRKLHQLALGGPDALGLAPETLPVFLRLRRLTPELLERGLEPFLDAELRELSGNTLPEGLGATLWRRRRLLLLCDGLDEIADEVHRARVLARLAWWLADPKLGDVRAVVSCRYTGWSPAVRDARLDGFALLDVRPFDDEQIARLVELWFREVERRGYLEPAVAAERGRELIRALTHPEHRRQEFLTLVSTPLLLTLLCLVVMRGGEMPRRRVDFFDECLRILLREWRPKQVQREPPVSYDRALVLLGELAWYLHSGHRRDDLTFPQALQLFHGQLGDRGRASAAFQWLVDDVAILERYTERHYGFAHLHLQEHLTARHLAEHEELLGSVCAEHGDSWWTQVVQLLAGLPGGKSFAPLVRRLLAGDAPQRRADLLAACLREASDPDLEPFYEVLRGDAGPERKIALLRLLRGRTEPPLLELARGLAAAGPEAVTVMAGQVLDAAKPTSTAQNDVFLVHAPADRQPAARLAGLLERRGLRVDRPGIAEHWDEPRVTDRMAACAAVLVLVGTQQPEPEEVMGVLALLEGGAAVVTLPGDPRPAVPDGLADLRHVDIESFDELDALVEALLPVAAPAAIDFSVAVEAARPLRVEVGGPFTEPVTGEVFLPVPAGRFRMGGTAYGDEQPVHWVRLSAFWLARTPVTNRQYRLFLDATGHEEPSYWRDRRFSEPDQPVVGVSWHDAVAYCRWLSEQSPAGRRIELPTEAQWEYAARGTDGWEYPWGNDPPNSERACFDLDLSSGQPAAVGSYPAGAGPFGQLDLAGNVWEWCRDFWEPSYQRWANDEPLDPIGEAGSSLRPLRGGAWWRGAVDLRSANRRGREPDARLVSIGFRLSCSPSSTVF
jgi:serine/threonine-protein kinase